MDLTEVRKQNLRTLVVQWDSATSLARALGHSNSSYIGHLLKGRKPFTERTARDIEQRLALPNGWLDVDRSGEPEAGRPVTFDPRLLERVISVTVEATKSNPLPPVKLTAIVVEVYTASMKSGNVDPEQVNRLIALTK